MVSSHHGLESCFTGFSSQTESWGGGEGCTSLDKMANKVIELENDAKEKFTNKFLFEKRRQALSGVCVIVPPLIKVKGVSWIINLCRRLLSDICSFQVEEMFKGWIYSLSQPHTVSNPTHSNLTDITSPKFSHFTHATAFALLLLYREICFHFTIWFFMFFTRAN